MRTRCVAFAQLIAAIAGLVATGGGMIAAGGVLPSPPASVDPGAWQGWWAATDPATALMGLLRLVAIGAAAWLLATTVLGLLARATRSVAVIAWADRAALPVQRRVLNRVAGVALVMATLGSASAAGAGPAPPAPAHLVRLPDAPDPAAGPPATVTRLPDGGPADPAPSGRPLVAPKRQASAPATTRRVATAAPRPAPATRRPLRQTAAAPIPPGARTYTVVPGDSFWRIAAGHEAQRLGRPPTDAEIGRYWVTLVAANRQRVVDPDLIFPGQVLELP